VSAALLRVQDLEVRYGPRVALAGVTWSFRAPGTTAIVGPSGCGKTTLLKALDRTLELVPGARVTRGSVWFRDADAALSDPLEIRQRIGLIHQKPVPFPMSIRENVLFGVRFRRAWEGRQPDEVARIHLQQAGLWEEVRTRLNEPASSLSGGQLQRLCLARTLANRPEVLLMDEPCSSLDPRATAEIERLVTDLQAALCIVIVTHNLAQAKRVAQEALILSDGRLVEAGDAAQVLVRPSDPIAQAFVEAG
jgi:phosphate transport system ATP-binding protein